MMEDMLYCKDLFGPLELNDVKPIETKAGDEKKFNRKTIELIQESIGHEILPYKTRKIDTYTLST